MAGYIGSNQPTNLSNTSADIDGTLTADGLTVDGAVQVNATVPSIVLEETDTTDINGQVAVVSGNTHIRTINDAGNSVTNRVTVSNSTGDISFYEDTGTTPKFYWDASAESLGIGTSSPSTSYRQEISMGASGLGGIYITSSNNASVADDHINITAGRGATNAYNFLNFTNSAGTMFKVQGDGNVGIGTSSPSTNLHMKSSGDTQLWLDSSATSVSNRIVSLGQNGGAYKDLRYDAGQHLFRTGTTERMRIDSSGNLLVGTTSTNPTTGTSEGIVLGAGGIMLASNTSDAAIALNRTTSNGDIAVFKSNGSEAGNVEIYGTTIGFTMYPVGNVGMRGATASIIPFANGSDRDNVLDLGRSTVRWDDIYATNGTIQTSDQNEKQQIASLTDAEITAAKAISKLFKTFKWNDSVAEKGDAARTHTGVIAQEVEQAMTDAGLNAGDYAFFISTTWWETQTEVPAVEAVEAVEATYDEDGNVLTEAVEAVEGKEAYTRTDTYETAEEAPEGATERNRKGIRYPQLLSFIGAATEQRLASIESRLDALESA